MMVVTLFTKSECSLCEDVLTALRGLQDRFQLRLELVDITTDEALFAKYRYRIPVVQFGRMELSAPIDPRQLELALQTELGTR